MEPFGQTPQQKYDLNIVLANEFLVQSELIASYVNDEDDD